MTAVQQSGSGAVRRLAAHPRATAGSPLSQKLQSASSKTPRMSSPTGNSGSGRSDTAARQALMRVCADASEAELETALAELGDVPASEELRAPQTGLVMLRGRIGGSGSAFNLGEATVTRAAVRLPSGTIGFSYLLAARIGARGSRPWSTPWVRTARYRERLEAALVAPVAGAPRRGARQQCAPRRRRRGSTSSRSCAARIERRGFPIARSSRVSAMRSPGRKAVFRVAMNAMARPGAGWPCDAGLDAACAALRTAAALLLTLCDFETPVWLDPPLARGSGRRGVPALPHRAPGWSRRRSDAAYAVISDTRRACRRSPPSPRERPSIPIARPPSSSRCAS